MFPVTKWNFLYVVEEKCSFHDQTKKMFNFENFTPFSWNDFSRSSHRRVVENLNMKYFICLNWIGVGSSHKHVHHNYTYTNTVVTRTHIVKRWWKFFHFPFSVFHAAHTYIHYVYVKSFSLLHIKWRHVRYNIYEEGWSDDGGGIMIIFFNQYLR